MNNINNPFRFKRQIVMTTCTLLTLNVITSTDILAEEISDEISDEMIVESEEQTLPKNLFLEEKTEIADQEEVISDDIEEGTRPENTNTEIEEETQNNLSNPSYDNFDSTKEDKAEKDNEKEIIKEDANDEVIIESAISAESKRNEVERYSQKGGKIVEENNISTLTTIAQKNISYGNSNDLVIYLKKSLLKLGYGDSDSIHWLNPNDYFGKQTEFALKSFQKDYGLSQTGVLDSLSEAKIEELLNNSYSLGDRHESIRNLKLDLLRLGYGYPDSIHWTSPDDLFGRQTDSELRAFQRANRLPENGLLDIRTLNRIESLLNESFSEGQRSEKVRELKSNLLKLGFGDPASIHWKNPDLYFGPQTLIALNNFQKAYGYSETQDYDIEMADKIRSILKQSFSYGQKDKKIRDLKINLLILGYGDKSSIHWTNPNGTFGVQTEASLEAFQKDYKLPVSGMLDPLTAKRIDELINESLVLGQEHEKVQELKFQLLRLGFGDTESVHWTRPDNLFGPQTESALKAFQKAYGYTITGIYDRETAKHLKTALENSYVIGQNDQAIKELKSKLLYLGYGDSDSIHWLNPNGYFGSQTELALRRFQKENNLPVNGLLDSLSDKKINDLLKISYSVGQNNEKIKDLKINLMKLGYGNPASIDWIVPNDYFGPQTLQAVKAFQKDHNLTINGLLNHELNFYIHQELKKKEYIYTQYDITLDQAVGMQVRAKAQTDKNYAYVSADWINSNGIVTASSLNVRSGAGSSNSIVGHLLNGDKVDVISEVNGWYQIKYSKAGWVDAAKEDVAYYLNPNNFIDNDKQLFQFLNLSRSSGVKASDLNKFLEGKGILEGQGQAFIDAGRIHGINEIYLLSHALLETGQGKSTLAMGVKVNGKIVYNMYGIGAYDNIAIEAGSQYAYDAGWFTPKQAIIDGARFIGNNYIKAGQNTLYKMRWNPNAMNNKGYATHQYATDVGWASKQVSTMQVLYDNIGLSINFLDIPVYKF